MLKFLSVKNFAIIDEIEVDFHPGLTIITGETGSGKSVLIQAISVTLGKKGTKTMVRSGTNRAVVEVQVNDTNFRRLISSAGRMTSYIEDVPYSDSKFRASTNSLVDFHGQHEQQLIMNTATHIDYLDSYSGLSPVVKQIDQVFQDLKTARQKLAKYQQQHAQAKDRQALLEFQNNEISLVNPSNDEDVQLTNDYKTLAHLEELIETVQRISDRITEGENSIYNQLSESIRELQRLAKYNSEINQFIELLDNSGTVLQDVAFGLVNHINAIDHDKDRLHDIEKRLQAIEGLKRKYGGTLEAVLLAKDEIERGLENYNSLGSEISSLEEKIRTLEKKYQELADRLHEARIRKVKKLSLSVESEMRQLNMPSASFIIQITQRPEEASFVQFNAGAVHANPNGYDQVQFYLSTNPGEKPKPLTEVASGGEISRIMLAIKTVFQKIDPVNTLVFDEIDTGISGLAAEKVADSLVKLAQAKQVVCITHLPQIASRADHHLHVTKTFSDSITNVAVRYLKKEERIQVIAQLFSGNLVPDESFQTAKSYIDTAHG